VLARARASLGWEGVASVVHINRLGDVGLFVNSYLVESAGGGLAIEYIPHGAAERRAGAEAAR
jgi:hypothetical protein